MERQYLLILLAVLLIGSVVVGTVAVSERYRDSVPSSCEELMHPGSYIWLPQKVADAFMGMRVILHFRMIDGNEIAGYGTVGDSAISDLHCGRPASFDYEVWMSDIDALTLATSTNPTTAFVNRWRRGQIRLVANNPAASEKLGDADKLVAGDSEPVPPWIRDYFGQFLK